MLKDLWAPKGSIEITDLPFDYYLVNFNCEEDYNFALCEGPWIILDHYLTIRKWFIAFNPSTDKISTLSAWVRFPQFPIDLFDNRFLTSFGDNIGKLSRLIPQ